ncbi:hypothetical protein Btru_043614 [Bulinus truncatus]|nr:hypothetical protein Btru_043614 [Bulinus truncatus]
MNTLVIVQIYNLVIMSASLSPCPVGFLPPECIHECQDGHYGVNCLSLCSATCLNVSCRPQSGECYRCQIGFFGPMCAEKCKPGFHGVNCSKTCPPNCLNRLCDPFSGFCLDCVNGYSGSHCETLQRLQSVVAYVNADTTKENNDHTVLYISIIVVTLTLPVCTVTLWVYILKRKFKDLNYKRLTQRNMPTSQIYRKSGVPTPSGDGGGKRIPKDQRTWAPSNVFENLDGLKDKKLSDAVLKMATSDQRELRKQRSEQKRREDFRKHSKESHGGAKGREDFGGGTSFVDNEQDDPAKVQELMQLLRKNTPLQLAQAANYSSNLFFKTPAPADNARTAQEPQQKLATPPFKYCDVDEFRSRARLSPLTEAADDNESVPNKATCTPAPTVSIEVNTVNQPIDVTTNTINQSNGCTDVTTNTINQSDGCTDVTTSTEKRKGSLKSIFLNSWKKLKLRSYQRPSIKQETNVEAPPTQRPNIVDMSNYEKGTTVSEVDFVQAHGSRNIGLVYSPTTEPLQEAAHGMWNLTRVLPPFGSVRIGQPGVKALSGIFPEQTSAMQAAGQEAAEERLMEAEERLMEAAHLCHSPAQHPAVDYDITSEHVRAQKVFSCPDISEVTKRFLPTSLIQNTRSVPGVKVIHVNANGENDHRLRRHSSPVVSRPKLTRKCGEFTKCNLNALSRSGLAAWDRSYHFDAESKVSPVHSYLGLLSSHDRGLRTSPRAFVSTDLKVPGLFPAHSSSALGDLYKPVEVSLHNNTMTPSGWPLNSLMNANPCVTSAETQLQRYSLLTTAGVSQSVSRASSPLFANNSDESMNVSVKSNDVTGNQDEVSDRSRSQIYSKMRRAKNSPNSSPTLIVRDHVKKKASPHTDRQLAHSPRLSDHVGLPSIKVLKEARPYSELDSATQTRLTGAKSSVRFAKTKECSAEKGFRTRMSRTISQSELASVPVGPPRNASPIPNRNLSLTEMKAQSPHHERHHSSEVQQHPVWPPENVAVVSNRGSIQDLEHCGTEEGVYIDQLDTADLDIQYYPENKRFHSNKASFDAGGHGMRSMGQAPYITERRHTGHVTDRRHPAHVIDIRPQGHVTDRRHQGHMIERRNSDCTGFVQDVESVKEMFFKNESLRVRDNKPPRGLPQRSERDMRYKPEVQVHRKPLVNAPAPAGLSGQHSSTPHLPVRESSTNLSSLVSVQEASSDEVRKRSPSCPRVISVDRLGPMRPNLQKAASSRSFNKTSSNNIAREVGNSYNYFALETAQRLQSHEAQRHEMLMRECQAVRPKDNEGWAWFHQYTNVHRSDARAQQCHPEDRSSNGFGSIDHPSSQRLFSRRSYGGDESFLHGQFRQFAGCPDGAQAENGMPRNQNNVGNIYDVPNSSTLGQVDFENHSSNSVHARACLRGNNDMLDYVSPSRLSDPGHSKAGPTKLAIVDIGKWGSKTAGKIRLTSPLQEDRQFEAPVETSGVSGNGGRDNVNQYIGRDANVDQQKERLVVKGPTDIGHSVHVNFKEKSPSLSTFALKFGEENVEEIDERPHTPGLSPTLQCHTKCLRDVSTGVYFPPPVTNNSQEARKTNVIQMGDDHSAKRRDDDDDDDDYALPLSERPLLREGQTTKLWWELPPCAADGSRSCPFSFTHRPGAVFTGCRSVPESNFLMIDRGVNTACQGSPVDIACQCVVAPVTMADKVCPAHKPCPTGGQPRQEENTEYRSIEDRDSEYFYDAVDYRDMENNTSKDQSSDFTRSSRLDSWDTALLGKHKRTHRPHSRDSLVDGANRSKHKHVWKKSKGRAFLGGGIPSELSDHRRKVKIHHGQNPNKNFALIFAPSHSKASSSEKSKFTASLTPLYEEAGAASSRASLRLVKVRSPSQEDHGLGSRKVSLPRIHISRVSARTGERYVDGQPRQDVFFDAS